MRRLTKGLAKADLSARAVIRADRPRLSFMALDHPTSFSGKVRRIAPRLDRGIYYYRKS
jgi:hypothetical protein